MSTQRPALSAPTRSGKESAAEYNLLHNGASVIIPIAVDPDRYGTSTIEIAVIVHHVYPSGNVTWSYVDDTGVELTWAREVTAQLEQMAHEGKLAVRVAA